MNVLGVLRTVYALLRAGRQKEVADWLLAWAQFLLGRVWGSFWGLRETTGRRIYRFLCWGVTLALSLAVLHALVQSGSMVYGRYALISQARIAAKQYRLKGEERVFLDLHSRAFDLGFAEAAMGPEAFEVVSIQRDGLSYCSVSFDFIHVVEFLGEFPVSVRIRGSAVDLPMEPLSGEALPED